MRSKALKALAVLLLTALGTLIVYGALSGLDAIANHG